MATATTPQSPLEPLAPSESFYEVVDGQIVEKAALGAYETWLANYLHNLIRDHAIAGRLGDSFLEILFDLAPAVTRQRRPDLAFLSSERWPIGRRAPRVAAWAIVPDLAIEVICPTNWASEVVIKLKDYFAAGVRRVWVIYPIEEQVYDYGSPTQVRVLTRADRLEGGEVLPGFAVELAELFGEPEAEPAA